MKKKSYPIHLLVSPITEEEAAVKNVENLNKNMRTIVRAGNDQLKMNAVLVGLILALDGFVLWNALDINKLRARVRELEEQNTEK